MVDWTGGVTARVLGGAARGGREGGQETHNALLQCTVTGHHSGVPLLLAALDINLHNPHAYCIIV